VGESMTMGLSVVLPHPLVIVPLNVAVSALVVLDVEPGAAPPTQLLAVDQLPFVTFPLQAWLAACETAEEARTAKAAARKKTFVFMGKERDRIRELSRSIYAFWQWKF